MRTTNFLKSRESYRPAPSGTLFLDYVDDLPLELQVKFLRVLDERRYERVGGEQTLEADVRVIAATRSDLTGLVWEGRFRAEMLYRLDVVRIDLPPLRERGDDVLLLATRFASAIAAARGQPEKAFAPLAMRALVAHAWPGNVRELAHAVERAFLLAPGATIELGDLPDSVRCPDPRAIPGGIQSGGVAIRIPESADRADLGGAVSLVEREFIRWALAKAGGSQTIAAKLLGIPRTTLRDRLERYGFTPKGSQDQVASES